MNITVLLSQIKDLLVNVDSREKVQEITYTFFNIPFPETHAFGKQPEKYILLNNLLAIFISQVFV